MPTSSNCNCNVSINSNIYIKFSFSDYVGVNKKLNRLIVLFDKIMSSS